VSRQEDIETICTYLNGCSDALFEAELVLAKNWCGSQKNDFHEESLKSPLEPTEGDPSELSL